MPFPLSSTRFSERHVVPNDSYAIASAVNEISRFRINRAFMAIISKSAAYTIEAEEDRIILVNASGGAVTITLPEAANADSCEYVIKATNVAGGSVTIDADGSETIDGSANFVLSTQYHSVRLASDGTTWHVTGRHT